MFHNRGHQLAIPDNTLHLLRHRLLLVISVFARRNGNVQTTHATGDDFHGVEAFLAQVDVTRVCLLDIERWAQAEDLRGEGWGRCNAELRNHRVEENGCSMTVEQTDGVDFSLDLDHRVLAGVDMHSLVEFGFFDDDLRVTLVVFL